MSTTEPWDEKLISGLETVIDALRQLEPVIAAAALDAIPGPADLSTPEPPPPAVYMMPGQPPVGAKVRQYGAQNPDLAPGIEYLRSPDPNGLGGRDWVACPPCTTYRYTWAELLGWHGPLVLVDRTPDEQAEDALYGPLGARWGDPHTPCPYPDCAYGTGHAGGHVRASGDPIPAPDTDPDAGDVRPIDMATPCTCATPHAHAPHCARYPRVAHQDGATP